MPNKLTPQEVTGQNRLWTAEVTPPEGGGRPWRSPGPMSVGDLMAALRAAGCNQPDIDEALREAAALFAEIQRCGSGGDIRTYVACGIRRRVRGAAAADGRRALDRLCPLHRQLA